MEEKEIKRLLKLAIKKELSIQDVTDAILSLHNKELDKFRKSDVSGSLQDRLFELANDFAVDKQGDVAVKLHIIHNGLQ